MSTLRHPSIFKSFSAIAAKYPHKAAVSFLGTTYSYSGLLVLAERLAGGLATLGLSKGDRIVMYIPNSMQFVVSWLAIQRLGAVAVPITPIYTVTDLRYIANDTTARAIICQDRNYGYVKQAMQDTAIKSVVVTNVADLLPWWKRAFGLLADKVPKGNVEKATFVAFMKNLIPQSNPPAPDPNTGEDEIAEILYTGGTTKHPKGVPINQGLFLVSAEEQLGVRDALFPKDHDVILGGAPLFHILGQTCSLATLVVGGGTLILQPRVNLDAVFDSIGSLKATSLIGVPAFYRMILEHDRVDQYDLSSLKYCFSAGDVLPLEVAKRWKTRFGLEIYQGYGATETCGGIVMCPTDRENPPMSMGLKVPSKEIMIVETGSSKTAKQGDPGELLVSSDRMVRAYLNKPEETFESFTEINGLLWYRTSDIVRQDENGFLYFVDRTVDTIKHKGYRISASEIEAVLQEHPAVIESCVVGIPDAKVGERIKAFVVLKKDVKGITGYELTKWCRDKLIAYKIPQYIEFRDMLPKSKVGKLLRREIRSEEKKRLET
ncbi:MAG: acyl--CoA ligase [Desulfomonile tiedjei]|uniref:Acyl--CoA ligase n=1 Tax=Desulfomonile tiedjei TaxID=2358 RepID=A0A9D6UY53_9BACT|nr:acyl--CoA ligase [Desulfomonile tiedjei]